MFAFRKACMSINKICITLVPSALFEGVDMRVITIQRVQYDATVHLFIGIGRSPGKSTFMSPIFTYDRNTSH